MHRLILIFGMLLFAGSAQAQTSGGIITESEKQIIRDYFKNKVGQVLEQGQTQSGTTAKPLPLPETTAKKEDGDKEARKDDHDKGGKDKDDEDADDRAKGKKHKNDKSAKRGKGRSKGKKQKKAKRGKGKNKGMPPGLAKRESLPPGLARQLEKNGKLPSGLAKRDLPSDLESKLPPPPEGTEREVVDNDIVLIDKAKGTILDILRDAAENVLTPGTTGTQ